MNFILRLGWDFQFLNGSKQHTFVYSYEMAFLSLNDYKNEILDNTDKVEDALCFSSSKNSAKI